MVGGKRGNHSGSYVKKLKQSSLRFLSEKTIFITLVKFDKLSKSDKNLVLRQIQVRNNKVI